MEKVSDKCTICGKYATGFASMSGSYRDDRFCHGDFDEKPTCYELAQQLKANNWFDHFEHHKFKFTTGEERKKFARSFPTTNKYPIKR